MQRSHRTVVFVVVAAAAAAIAGRPGTAGAQVALSPPARTGAGATPAFEGWYRNADGTLSVSFGYFNRNSAETLHVPVGPDNYITPGPANQGQPTHFEPRRHWGVFAITVPADRAAEPPTWTLVVRGDTFSIPANLHPDWEIDALEGEAGSNNTPPLLRFPGGGEGRGPRGVSAPPVRARVGEPVPLSVWAQDDGRASGSVATAGRAAVPVTLTWLLHQGQPAVTFSDPVTRVPVDGGTATTSVTFAAPGEYLLRVRANDASGVSGAGHAQCCWTNGFVRVVVTR